MNLLFFCCCCRGCCSTGLWLTSSLERVCYARVQPRPSGADRCRRYYPVVIVWRIPEVQEQTVEAVKVDPEERVRQSTVEQVGNVPVPQCQEQIGEVVTVAPQERISWCVSSENCHKRGYYFTWSRESYLLLPRQHACPECSWLNISISSILSRIANVLEKPRG